MATEDLLVGRTLEGRYRILDRIARGGMSTVYSAVDERLDRLVAVKVMSSALSADPAFSDRFTREARAAARLAHVNTVAVFDQGSQIGPDGHHVFLVMELVHGRTLRELIRDHGGRFTPTEALSIMQPVLSALSAAHAAGIVHRDVKPENILISDDGVVKVADFGLARAVEADASATRTGLMMGTVAYCAPEQITRGEADQRTDVYAAGVVLFELLTGRPPFQGDTAMNIAYQHVHGRVPAPSSRVRGIPSEIDELVVMATDPEPDERPADAGEFLAEIADVRAELGLPSVPVPVPIAPARTRRAAPDRSPADADTTALTGARSRHQTQVVAGSGARSWRVHDTAPERGRGDGPAPPVVIPPSRHKPPTARQRRRRRGLVALVIVVLLGAAAALGGWWFASGRYSRVPTLAGLSQSAAKQRIQDAGFSYGGVTSSRYSETVPKHEVIGSEPGPGSRHVHGTKVSLVLSLGPQRIAVPDVSGMSLGDAQSAIRSHGLTVGDLKQRHSTTVRRDRVIASAPKVGTQIRKTQPVDLIISLGPPKVQVPDIPAGTSYQDAVQALEHAHFKPVRGSSEYSTDVAKGDVISVRPQGKQTEFSQITIIVSKGPQMVTIPDIPRGSSTADAQAKLQDLNLQVEVRPFLPFASTDHVYAIDPGAGTPVPVGSKVTITTY